MNRHSEHPRSFLLYLRSKVLYASLVIAYVCLLTTAKAAQDIPEKVSQDLTDIKSANTSTKSVVFSEVLAGSVIGPDQFDFKEGVDKIEGIDGRVIYLDGSQYKSIEIFTFAKGRPHDIRIMAPGLNNLENDFLELQIDPSLDKASLDSCLDWKKVDAALGVEILRNFKADSGLQLWVATDAAGEKRHLALTSGAHVTVAAVCDSNYSEQVNQRNKIHQSSRSAPRLSPEKSFIVPYHPDPARIAAFYEDEAKKTSSSKLASSLERIVSLIRAHKLPAEFITSQGTLYLHAIRPLGFIPNEPVYKKIDNNFDCLASRRTSAGATLILDGNDLNASCGEGDHIFLLGDGDDKVTTTAGGLQVFIPGKGNDIISGSGGSFIVILDKNWGHKSISKKCLPAGMIRGQQIYRTKGEARAYTGIGVRLERTREGRISIHSFLPGSLAQQAGLRIGDYIVSLYGQPFPAGLENAVSLIRGPAGSTVELGIEREGEVRLVKIRRNSIATSPTTEVPATSLQPIDYKWPYDHDSFILFGPGIRKADLVEEETGKWWNTKTGDRLDISPCFNWVFAE